MALTAIQRCRIILDLLKDGDVADEAVYRKVDMADEKVTLKYCQAFYGPGGPLAKPGEDPTEEHYAAAMLHRLRNNVAEMNQQSRVSKVQEQAMKAAKDAVAAEAKAELGM